MIRPILRYGAPELQQRAAAVHGADPDLAALVADLVETMQAAAGVGLAAPQVGVSKRVFVIDLSADAARRASSSCSSTPSSSRGTACSSRRKAA